MIRTDTHRTSAVADAASPLLAGLLARLFPGRRRAAPIDPDALPDALRRDLGFTDGRPVGARDPRWD